MFATVEILYTLVEYALNDLCVGIKYQYIVTVLVLLILVFMKSTPIFNIDMCIFRNYSKPPNEHVVIDDTGPI